MQDNNKIDIEQPLLPFWDEEEQKDGMHSVREYSLIERDVHCFGLGGRITALSGRIARSDSGWCCFCCGGCEGCGGKKRTGREIPILSTSFLTSLSWSCRTAAACLIGSILCLIQPASVYFDIYAFLVPVMSILTTGPNLGKSMTLGWYILSGAVVGNCVGLAAALAIKDTGEAQRPLTGLAIVLTCFPLYVVNKHSIFRKIALLLNLIALFTFLQHPDASTIHEFKAVLCCVIGVGCGLLVCMFPWPVLASRNFDKGMDTNLIVIASIFEELVKWYCCPPQQGTQRMLHKANVDILLKTAKENIDTTKQMYADAVWEKTFQKNVNAKKYIALLERCLELLQGIEKSLSADKTPHTHYSAHLSDSLQDLSSAIKDLAYYMGKKRRKGIGCFVQKGDVVFKSRERAVVDDALMSLLQQSRDRQIELSATKDSALSLSAALFNTRALVHLLHQLEDTDIRWSWSYWLNVYYENLLKDTYKTYYGLTRRLCRIPVDLVKGKESTHSTWSKIRKFLLSRKVGGAAQLTFTILIASLIVLVEQANAWFSYASWAPWTVALVFERGKQGENWRLILLRFTGTVSGTIVAYFIVIAVDDNPYAIAVLLTVWAFFAGYARADKEYSYSGMVAAFTAPLIVFYNKVELTPELIRLTAISRIEATMYVIVITAALIIFWPLRAAPLLREKMLVDTFNKLKSYADLVLGGKPTEDSSAGEAAVKVALATQTGFIRDASLEVQLWWGAFPADIYTALAAFQTRLISDLASIKRALVALSQEENKNKQQLASILDELQVVHDKTSYTLETLTEALKQSSVVPLTQDSMEYPPMDIQAAIQKLKRQQEEGEGEDIPFPHHDSMEYLALPSLLFWLQSLSDANNGLCQSVCTLLQKERFYVQQ